PRHLIRHAAQIDLREIDRYDPDPAAFRILDQPAESHRLRPEQVFLPAEVLAVEIGAPPHVGDADVLDALDRPAAADRDLGHLHRAFLLRDHLLRRDVTDRAAVRAPHAFGAITAQLGDLAAAARALDLLGLDL